MAQPVINTSPYFDDFDADKDFYKVLFKPGFPVQARELTTLQSILQNQISSFGEHFFKEGSVVIPGSITYNPNYTSVVLNSEQSGVEISLYLEQLVGTEIIGEITGISAKVIDFRLPPNDGVSNPTIFVQYLNSGTDDETQVFNVDEALINQSSITYGNTTIAPGSIIATTVPVDATFIGSAANISEGVYFLRGTFVQVQNSTVILEPYNNLPSYRVGLQINELIVTADQDSSLYDNAKGFNNFSAPGADRLKIETTLIKKLITDTNDTNFVELLRVEAGDIKILEEKTNYNIIRDYLAERTFDESGDYVVSGMEATIDESLNDRLGNGGIYFSNQSTAQGSTPSDDLAIVKVGRGKAYVRGYDIDNVGTTNLDAPKPRTTQFIENTSIPFEMGSLFVVNNVTGTPSITLDTDNPANDILIEIYNQRLTGGNATQGEVIGYARPYNFALEDAPYTGPSTPWTLYLYDTQFFTRISLNRAATDIKVQDLVRGVSSGATGYVQRINGDTVYLIQVTGEFQPAERLAINTTDDSFDKNSYSIRRRALNGEPSVITYSAADARAFEQNSGNIIAGLPNFTAEALQYTFVPQGFSPSDSFRFTTGTNRLTSPGRIFSDFSIGDLVAFQASGTSTIVNYARVASIDADESGVILENVASVPGVCIGTLPGSQNGLNLRKLRSRVFNNTTASLYTTMENRNVSSVSLDGSSLLFTTQVTGLTITNGQVTINNSVLNVDNATFVAFDQERYQLFQSDGTPINLSASQVTVTPTLITFSGLTNQSGVSANVTASKNNTRSKTKVLARSQTFLIDKTNNESLVDDSDLTLNQYYGWRIEDESISLNVPDVESLVAVYESLDTGAPILDVVGFAGGLELDTNTTAGELLRGADSGAVAQLIDAQSPSELRIVYLSQSQFQVGELISFSESQIETNLQQIFSGSYKNITSNFTLDKGQREQFYDYSRITRTSGAAPTRKTLVIFNRFIVPSDDKGDFYTANSYDPSIFGTGVPFLNNGSLRASDTLDFRPRVPDFTDTNASPFYYTSRDFAATGSTVSLVAAPNEDISLGYNFYLGRIDRLILNTEEEFRIIFGSPSVSPEIPSFNEAAIELARIEYPPYLYNVDDAKIILIDNRRYTMRDIGGLEDRIETLEEVTSLSLLERETESLQVLDADGNSRFKTGFFVDDFDTSEFIDYSNPETRIDADVTRSQLVPFNEFATVPLRPQLQASLNPENISLTQDLPLADPNTIKTGDLITLDYNETQWLSQPLASRTENVNPFNVILYVGGLFLNPASDDFVATVNGGPNGRLDVFGGSQQSFSTQFVENIEVAQFMRERNVGFNARSLRPNTLFYAFFEGSGGMDIIPKLIEINMNNGSFQIGETVEGFVGNNRIFSARVAAPNHKSGAFNAPVRTYSRNPYIPEEVIPDNYSASSNVLNIDIDSLADISDDRFFGLISQNTRLVGRSSRAIATISNIRLISDNTGDVAGSIFFRDPYTNPAPVFRLRTGTRTFRLTSSPTDETPVLGSTSISFAETTYISTGTIQNIGTLSISVRELPPPPPPVIIDRTVTNNFTEVIDRTVTINNNFTRVERRVIDRTVFVQRPPQAVRRADPLAQTFTVDETGAFLTTVDIYMATKPTTEDTLTVQIRTTELGTPTEFIVQDFAEVILSPSQVNVSEDASIPTTIQFPSPIYLEPGITYSIVLLAPTTDDYTAWIARMGEPNITGVNDATGEVIISQQYLNGSLFKSQNGQIWTPSQFEDLKFTLYKAVFTQEAGNVFLENPPIRTSTPLINNPIETIPRRITVPVTQQSPGYTFALGAKYGTASGAPLLPTVFGDLEAIGGSVATLGPDIETGPGYVDGTYNNVTTFPVPSVNSRNIEGSGLTLNITISGGEITSATIVSAGTGYREGDVVGITTSESGGSGGDTFITIGSVSTPDTLFLGNVIGEALASPNTIYEIPPTGPIIDTNYAASGNSVVTTDFDQGNVFILNLPVHGLNSDGSLIDIFGILPDTIGVPILQQIGISASEIVVNPAQAAIFSTFEGLDVGTGYLYIGGEIIEYEYNAGTITISERGIDNTAVQIHSPGALAFKYEISGVSIRRINTQLTVPADNTIGNRRDINTLPLTFDRTPRNGGDTQLNFNQRQQAGLNVGRASQNFQYDRLLPSCALITPGNTTNIETTIRTVSGTSAGGSEISYLDQGFESINLNSFNRFDTPRLVASISNETAFLPDIPGNKSLTLALQFSTSDPNLSPVLDTTQMNAILARFSLNNPVSDYAGDERVKLVVGDPHSSIYISNRVELENPSTSLDVFLTAYRDASADFRVCYRLFGPNTQGETDPSWELFPGYPNLVDTTGNGIGDRVIDPSQNTGLPNRFVRASNFNEFLEYEYAVDNLPEFTGYQIKVMLSGTNEARAPFFREIRTIALG